MYKIFLNVCKYQFRFDITKHQFKFNSSTSTPLPKPNFKSASKSKEIGSFGWFLLIIPASTFALGTWQIQRKKWKENLIKELKSRSEAEPINLPETLEETNKLEYYPVHVRGEFLHDKEIHIGPRTLLEKGDASTTSQLISKGQKSQGYLVITPFKLADRDETILVNRGWIPSKNRDPKTRQSGQIEGLTDVIGVIRLHENRPNFMPSNQEQKNVWFYRDLDRMSEITGSSPIFIDATKDFEVENGPIAGQTRISLRNEHLSYIFTWYSLCGLTSYMWYKQFIKVQILMQIQQQKHEDKKFYYNNYAWICKKRPTIKWMSSYQEYLILNALKNLTCEEKMKVMKKLLLWIEEHPDTLSSKLPGICIGFLNNARNEAVVVNVTLTRMSSFRRSLRRFSLSPNKIYPVEPKIPLANIEKCKMVTFNDTPTIYTIDNYIE